MKNLKDNTNKGLISFKAKKKIHNAIDWMLAQSVKKKYYSKKHKKHFWFRVNFITLTLCAPQMHSDNEIKKKMLNNMLVQLRQKWSVKKYLWRAESQLNGNIHFHIICDKFIPWWQLRHTWNKIQNNLGYVDRFFAKHGHDDPNSTDVHEVKNIKNLGAYIAKYASKNSMGALYTPIHLIKGKYKPCFNPSLLNLSQEVSNKVYRVIQGNLWNLSETLSQIKASVEVVYGKVRDEIEAIKRVFKHETFTTDWFEYISVPTKSWACIVKGVLWDSYQNNLQLIRQGHVQNQIF